MRKLGSCGEAVVVDESAETVATLNARCGWVNHAELGRVRLWRCEIERAIGPVALVVVDED
nr:MetaGeneMark_Unknown Function [uncultured bacterium]